MLLNLSISKYSGYIGGKNDKIKYHVLKLILKKLGELKYGALPQPPYSPDLFPTVFDFSKHLDAFFRNRLFKNQESAESEFSDFY
uniref:DDE_3 domain-containing protein n=1 Tax=Strongyloides papillosus TaxID=174720 RepID=A0A0N5C5M7_STREA